MHPPSKVGETRFYMSGTSDQEGEGCILTVVTVCEDLCKARGGKTANRKTH